MEEVDVNKTFIVSLVVFASLAVAPNGSAGVLPKDVLAVKNDFDKAGATRCSQVIAETFHFLAKGRAFSINRQWGTTDTNRKPISLDFMITGTKSDYSLIGAIDLAPVGDRCIGTYVYSYVAPSQNCKAYMQKAGFDGPNWKLGKTYPNGDGGSAYFLSVKTDSSLNFIFNDVAGGCSVTKREPLDFDAGK